jgi:hypothetical protein
VPKNAADSVKLQHCRAFFRERSDENRCAAGHGCFLAVQAKMARHDLRASCTLRTVRAEKGRPDGAQVFARSCPKLPPARLRSTGQIPAALQSALAATQHSKTRTDGADYDTITE